MKASDVKRLTFSQIAKRECAECTITITTTLSQTKYIPESDFLAFAKEAEEERDMWRVAAKDAGEAVRILQSRLDEAVKAMEFFESWWRSPNDERTIAKIEMPMLLCLDFLSKAKAVKG